MTDALEIRDVRVHYRRRHGKNILAVAGADLTVPRGQIVGLVGESGCGKSSLAKAAVGLVPISSGSIRINGNPLTYRKYRARSRNDRAVQMVFQNPYGSLNPRRKVGAQIADGLGGGFGAAARRARRQRVAELLAQVGMPTEAADRFPHQYSGGQRQRIAIARALAASPSILVLDEPLSSLDASVQAQVCNLLRELTDELNLGMLLISHDLALVQHIANIVAVMYLGEIVEVGPTAQLWSKPAHPYTQALIAAIPRINSVGKLPQPLPGEVPDPGNPPQGCRFRPRCPVAFDACTRHPTLFDIDPDRRAACWLVTGGQLVEGERK